MEQVKKIVIIGSKGMAGHVLYFYLKNESQYQIIDIARDAEFHIPSYQIDITDFVKLKDVLNNEKPDFVINCIGILNKDAEDNPDKAILLNCYFPHFLARLGSELEYKLIHISTDCVFNGRKGSYTEESEKDGIGFYAQSKALGEVNDQRHLTLRTSIIGPELKDDGIGLFHWFMHQDGLIKGYTEAYWTGVTTIELAKAIRSAIEQNISGLYHLVNNEKISKYDLISLIKEEFHKDNLIIEPFDDYKVDKSLVRTKVDFQYAVPSYQQMIADMKLWIETYSENYRYSGV